MGSTLFQAAFPEFWRYGCSGRRSFGQRPHSFHSSWFNGIPLKEYAGVQADVGGIQASGPPPRCKKQSISWVNLWQDLRHGNDF